MTPIHMVKLLHQCRIAPPPRSAGESSLPSTFFDLVFYNFPPVQRLFFYELPESKPHFLESYLPKLKHSLALTLQHYYPLAGHLTRPSDGLNPEIRYTEGDSVSLTVAESVDDFYELSENHAKDVTRFHSLVPELYVSDAKLALLSIQVTLFPNAGITIGTSIHHAAADGSSYTHFMKTWALFSRLGEKAASSIGSLPFYDRTVIQDPRGLGRIFLSDLEALKEDRSLDAWDLNARADVVRATFVFGCGLLEKLGRRVFSKTSLQCSPYTSACGYVWSCLVKARGDASKKTEYFGFVTGCRPRLDPPIPATYFGNCLGICRVEAKRSDLAGEDGAVVASEAIWKVIRGLEEEAFGGSENWVRDVFRYASARALTVAGSPKLGIYKIDFGWGRPRKVDLISIERTGALSLAESRDEQGGIEVGLALPKYEMEEFVSVFVDGLRELS